MRRPLRSDEARAVAGLAIELGDPGRMARARRAHRGGAVTDVGVDVGRVRGVIAVEGEAPVTVEFRLHTAGEPGEVPEPEEIESECSADDEDMCVHRLAVILGFAEEVEANPELLSIWVAGPAGAEVEPPPAPHRHHPFFTGDHEIVEHDPLPEHPAINVGSLVVDGLDVWPVLADARAALTDEVSRSAR